MNDVTAPALAGQGTATTPSAENVPITSSPAPGTVPTATTPSANMDWLTGAPDDISGYVQNKGWKTPIDAVDGYRNLEKHMGVPADKLLRLPDWDKADKVELDQFFGKLGRPSDPNGYSIKPPEGQSGELSDWAKPVFHEAGLTDRQAKVITDKWNEYISGSKVKQDEALQQSIAQQNEELRREWGSAYDQELGSAKNAAIALGMKQEQIDKLENSLGFSGLMKMMANIGKRIGEDKFVSGEGVGGNGAMTPAMAKSRIQQLQGDKEFTAKYLAGNVQSKAEMERLHAFAYPTIR